MVNAHVIARYLLQIILFLFLYYSLNVLFI